MPKGAGARTRGLLGTACRRGGSCHSHGTGGTLSPWSPDPEGRGNSPSPSMGRLRGVPYASPWSGEVRAEGAPPPISAAPTSLAGCGEPGRLAGDRGGGDSGSACIWGTKGGSWRSARWGRSGSARPAASIAGARAAAALAAGSIGSAGSSNAGSSKGSAGSCGSCAGGAGPAAAAGGGGAPAAAGRGSCSLASWALWRLCKRAARAETSGWLVRSRVRVAVATRWWQLPEIRARAGSCPEEGRGGGL